MFSKPLNFNIQPLGIDITSEQQKTVQVTDFELIVLMILISK